MQTLWFIKLGVLNQSNKSFFSKETRQTRKMKIFIPWTLDYQRVHFFILIAFSTEIKVFSIVLNFLRIIITIKQTLVLKRDGQFWDFFWENKKQYRSIWARPLMPFFLLRVSQSYAIESMLLIKTTKHIIWHQSICCCEKMIYFLVIYEKFISSIN